MSKSTRTNRRNPRTPARLHATPAPVAFLPLRKTWPISLCVGLVVGSIVFSSDALAGGPAGGVVVGGSGTITHNGNSTIINQASNRLALNWQTFNVGANESVLFNQPSRSAVALNRILDQNPSQIFGRINSNGQIFLINTHGIIFGATAQMNVGGLMASTLDLTPNDFLAGHYNLNAIAPAAGVVNHGLIQAASGGSVSLVGGNVVNDGLILANYGKINLDGADHATLDFDGNGLINIQITGELKQRLDAKEAAVTNKGTLEADGGTVVLQASAAKDLFTNLVNNSGLIDASSISNDGGVVRLVASGGNAESSGTIDVSGKHGGRIQALSDRDVRITGGTLDASGSQGGGAIRVGGGIRGGESLAIADRAYVADGVTINADATVGGNGGSIAVFSQNNSVVAGSLFARGGIQGGNGGFVETSSHGALTITDTPQVGARNTGGFGGDWLIDPNNIDIVAGGGNTNINATDPFLSTNDGASLGVDLITQALTGGANVTVTTGSGGTNAEAGDITLNAGLDYDGKGSNALTFDAAHDIVINSSIFDSTPGGDVLNLSLIAGNNINLANNISLGAGSATLTATAGSITQTAGKLSAGTLNATAATGINLNTAATLLNVVNTGATGDIAITEADGATVQALQQTDVTNTAGTVSLTSASGNIGIDDGSVLSQGGLVTLTATAGAITDADGGTATSITNAGGQAMLDAATGIGAVGVGNEIDTQLGTLAFANSGTGDVSVTNTGALTVSGTSGSGNVGITSTTGNLAVGTSGIVTAGGAVTLKAAEADAGITIGTGNTLRTTNGVATGANVSLIADNADVTGTIDAGTAGTVTILQSTAGRKISLGSETSGQLGLTGTEFDQITANTIVIGDANSGDLGIFAAIAPAHAANLSLNTGGAISQAAGATITVGTLTGSSVGATALGEANQIGKLGSFTAASFSLTNAAPLTLAGDVTTSGTQTYNAALALGSDATLTTTNSAVTFAGTVDNADPTARNLTVNTGSGAVTFGGAVGSDATNGALGALTVNSTGLTSFGNVAATSVVTNAGGSTLLGGNVTTSGTQTYNDAVILGSDAILTTTNSAVTFAGTVDNADPTARNLTVNTGSGAVTFGGAVGSDATNGALGALTVNSTGLTSFGNVAATSVVTNAGGSTLLGGNVTTSGTQTYNDAVTLGSDATLTTTNSAVNFAGTVDNVDPTARNLTVNTGSGAVTFGGAVGSNATNGVLAGLTIQSGSLSAKSLNIGSGGLSVTTTTGDITQGGKFVVTGLSSFNSGNHAISLTDAGNDFQGDVSAVGAGVSLVDANDLQVAALTDNANGNVSLIAGGVLSVPTAGIAAGNGDLTLESNGGALSTSGALSGTNVSLTGRDGVTLGGDLSALGTLKLTSTNAGIAQTGGSITTGGASTVNAGTGDITLAELNGFGDAVSLTGHNVSLTNNVATKLGTSTVTGSLGVASNGALTQTGALTVTGAATFTQNSAAAGITQDIDLGTQDNSFQGGVTFAGTINNLALKNINATPGTLTLPTNVAGNFTLNYTNAALTLPVVGVGGALDVTASGGIAINGDVTTGGSQTYHDAVTLGSDATLTTTNSAVNFVGTVDNADPTARNLTVNTGSGAVTFGGAVGSNATNGALAGLTIQSGSLSAKTLNIGSGGLSVTTTTGDITQSGKFVVTGLSSFNSGNHAISLTDAGNDFQGDVSAVGAGVSLVDVNDLQVAALTDNANGNVSLIAGGVLSVPTAGIAAGNGDLTLESNGGALSTSGALSGNNVSLTGRDGVTLGGDLSALGTLKLTSTNAGIAQTGGNITAGGASTVNAGTGAITLTQVNDFTGAVTLTGGTTQITDANALTLGALGTGALTAISTGTLNLGSGTVAGHLDATSNGGAIIQSGALNVTGGNTSAIDAGSGTITLTQANDFTGAVTLTGGTTQITDANALTLGALGTGALTAISAGTLNLGSGTVAGHLDATSNGGAVIQSGALNVTGGNTSAIDAGSGTITLTQANDFTGAVTLTGGTTQITDANALTLGALGTGALTAISAGTLNLGSGTVAGHLDATSNGGAVIQSGALNVTGGNTSAIDAGSGTITLTQANDFTGAVTLTGGTTQITDANALTLGALGTGALTAISTGTLNLGSGTVDGALIASSNGGAIGQTNAMTVTGSSAINAGNGVLALTQANNDFQGAVTVTGAGVSLVDVNDLSVTALTDNANGNVSLVSGGALTLPTSAVAAGTGNLTLASNGGALSTSNALSGTNVSLTGRDGVALGGNVSALGTLELVSTNAAITQLAGNIAVAGLSTVTAGSGAITLGAAGNDFGGAVNLAGGATQITDQNALTLGTLTTGALTAISTGALNLGSGNVSGNLVATSNNGAINQAGALRVTGTSAINAGTDAVTLTQANNDFQGSVSATGTGVSITDANDLAIAGLNDGANGTVSLIAGGVLTLPAGSINTGSANLTLTSNGGSLATAGALSGANISLTGHGGVALNNNVTAAGTLGLFSGAAISQGAGIITAGSLIGSSVGNTTLGQANKIGTLGHFSAANFSLNNAWTLSVNGPLTTTGDTGNISLKTTSGDLIVHADLAGGAVALTSAGNLALTKNLKGTTVALSSGGNLDQSGGIITAGVLSGGAVGSATLNQANRIAALGAFSTANGLSLISSQALTVNGPVSGGASTALTTTAGGLVINGAVSGTTTTLKSAAAITEGAGGSITASTLSGQSAGATALNGNNHIGTLGKFSAASFGLTNAQTLTVSGPLSGGSGAALTTTAGNLVINAAISGTTTTLKSAGAISEGVGGSIAANRLDGQSVGATSLDGTNHIGTLGRFSAASFGLTNAQGLTVSGPVNGGASTSLTTTAGDLMINGQLSGATTTLKSAGAISEGAGGSITANLLTGHAVGNTTLDGNNHIDTLGSFSADFSLTNAQTLTVAGPLDGGPVVALTTTAGDLLINGAINGATTTLKSAGAIREGAGGGITASTLSGQSAGATALTGDNHIGTLGSFSAASLDLTSAQALTVGGPISGGASTTLTTTAGDLTINGAVSGTSTALNSAGAIIEGVGGSITAGTLSGHAVGGPTELGSATHRINNMVDILGNFSSPAGFSMTNDKSLTLASVGGSAFTVDAGTSAFYLSVTHGDLFQLGTAPVYNSTGVWSSTGRMGTGSAPIYVVGTGPQTIAMVGLAPAYFYAIDSTGSLLPLGGGLAINVPTASGAGSAQNGNHGDSYIDPGVITANYRSYGIVPSGVRLPEDQQSGCDPDQPDQLDCEDADSVGMVNMRGMTGAWMSARP
ncbi:filamentous hemagglutinin N-terminal domain-containing protein [Rhodanobacter sp. T12-5]|uniref:two-partner secretion domain-containing protein n=1 Tax=Rhodanobacter sp. T12-5 TaxID=2024611 RepID=UPI001562151F|nr:filamentous hemagglutinin N-terminal domain-containing protein [Rhodanobacter sp. T12-5]